MRCLSECFACIGWYVSSQQLFQRTECKLLWATWSSATNSKYLWTYIYFNFALVTPCIFSFPLLVRTDEVGQTRGLDQRLFRVPYLLVSQTVYISTACVVDPLAIKRFCSSSHDCFCLMDNVSAPRVRLFSPLKTCSTY